MIASHNADIVGSVGRIKESMDLMNKDAKNLTVQISIKNREGVGTSYKVLNKSAKDVVDEINKLMDKINSKSRPKGNYIDGVFNFFDSYTTAPNCAVGHIFACNFIFGCLYGITIAFYGNYLINYYKLEEKYPWLVKWIRLRIKLMHYYIGLNIFLIILILLFIIYVNLVVLKYAG